MPGGRFTLTMGLNVTPPNLGPIVANINKQLKNIKFNAGLGNFTVPPNVTQGLNNLNKGMQNVSKNTRTAADDFERFGASAAASLRRFAGFTIFASTFFVITRAIKSSIGEAIEFQHELVKIRQVTGTALKDLSGLTEEVTRLATTFGVSSKKILNAAQVLSQAGLSADDVTESLRALALTDVSPTFENIEQTTEGAIAIMTQFKKEAKDLEGIFGSLNAVAAKFAVESSDLVTVIKRAGGPFAQLNGDVNELAALFTSVRATTRESAETISTGLRTIFTRLQRTRTINFLDTLGIQLRDSEGQFVGLFESIRRLSRALSDIPPGDARLAQIFEELGGFRQISKTIPLINELKVGEQALVVARRGTKSLTDAANKAQDSFAIKIRKVREEFEALIRSLSNNTAFKAMIEATLKLSSALIKLTQSLEPLLPALGVLGGVGAGIAINRIAPQIIGGFPGLSGALGGGGSKGSLNGPATGVGLGGSAVLLLLSNMQGLSDESKKLTSDFSLLSATAVGLNFLFRQSQEIFGGPRAELGKLTPQRTEGVREVRSLARGLTDITRQSKAADSRLSNLDSSINNRIRNIQINAAALKSPFLTRAQEKQYKQENVIEGIRLRRDRKEFTALDPEAQNLRNLRSAQQKELNLRQKELHVLDRQIKTLTKFEYGMDSANIAIAATSAYLITFGQNLEKTSRKQLELGNALAQSQFARGRAQTQGGIGAGIGGTIGGLVGGAAGLFLGKSPVAGAAGGFAGQSIGAALGGAIGGLLGFNDGLKEAVSILAGANFARSFKGFKRLLDDVQEGRSNVGTRLGSFQTNVIALDRRLLTAPSTDKETAAGQIEDAIVGIDNFLNRTAELQKSFEDFQRVIGTDVLQIFADFTDTPIKEVNQRFRELIEGVAQANQVRTFLNAEEERQLQRLREFNSLSGALQDTILRLEQFESQVDKIGSFIDGSVSTTRVSDISSIFERPESTADIGLLQQAIRQTIGGFGGRGAEIGSEAASAAEAVAKLPDILATVGNKTFGETQDFITEFEKVLRNAIVNVPEFVVQAFKANLFELRGPEAKDSRLIEDARNNPIKLTKAVSTGTLTSLFDFLKTNAQLLVNQTNQLGGLYDKRRQIEERLIDGLASVIDLQEQRATFNFERLGKTLPLDQAQAFDRSRLFNKIPLGQDSSPEALGGSLIESQNRILSLNLQLQEAEADKRAGIIEQISAEEEKRVKLIAGLQHYTDVVARNAALQRELEKVQKGSQAKFDLVESFVFGDIGQRASLTRGAFGAGALAQNNNINTVPFGARGETLDFLKRFEDVTLPFLGGQTGNDVIRKTIESSLVNFGVDKDKAAEIAKRKTTAPEQQIVDAINKNFETAEKAQVELLNVTKVTQIKLLEQIVKNTADFKILRERNFLQSDVTTLQDKQRGIGSKIAASNEAKSTIDSLVSTLSRFGLSINEQNFTSLRQAVGTSGQIAGLAKNKSQILDRRKALGPIPGLLDESFTGNNFTDIFRHPSLSSDPSQFNSAARAGRSAVNALPGGKITLSAVEIENLKKNFTDKFGADIGKLVFNKDFNKQIAPDENDIVEFIDVFRARIELLTKDSIDQQRAQIVETDKLAKQLGILPSQAHDLVDNITTVSKLFGKLPDELDYNGLLSLYKNTGVLNGQFKALTEQIDGLLLKIKALETQSTTSPAKPPIARAGGGPVPGYGNTDSVAARLMPGEFVIRKRAAQALGPDVLNDLNNTQTFAEGGQVLSRKDRLKRTNQLLGRRSYAERNKFGGRATVSFADRNRLSPERQARADNRKAINQRLGRDKPAAGPGLIGPKAGKFFAEDKKRVLDEAKTSAEYAKGERTLSYSRALVGNLNAKQQNADNLQRVQADVANNAKIAAEKRIAFREKAGLPPLTPESKPEALVQPTPAPATIPTAKPTSDNLTNKEDVSKFLAETAKNRGLSFNGTIGDLAPADVKQIGQSVVGKNQLNFDFSKPVDKNVVLHEFGHNIDDRLGAALGRRGKESVQGDLFKDTLDVAKQRLLANELDVSKQTPLSRDQLLEKPQELFAALFAHPEEGTKINDIIKKNLVDITGNPIKFAGGGLVPGIGNTDNVSAKLTPGEFVLKKDAVKNLGVDKARSINSLKSPKKYAEGGPVTGGGAGFSIPPNLIESFNRFGENANRLAASLDSFPREVSFTATHTVNVIHNGAAVFSTLTESFTQLVQSTVQSELNKMIKAKFPDVGSV